ncbi:MAG: serine hydrolase family protein [Neisseriaceae bacterium]|nr:serine hydrolase family protein [Neisseriaceae bacterium]MBP6861606.1 serine hydrolase family protein [Neisseriaceae bacterium]
MNTVYIIHGFQASPASHWFPWLKQQLNRRRINAHILSMPHPTDPKLAEWVAHLQARVNTPTANTYFVAHSLGCIMLLYYIATTPLSQPFGGMVLVSGFYEPLPPIPTLHPKLALELENIKSHPPLHFDLIRSKVALSACVSSGDDAIVPTEFSQRLAQKLNAPHYLVDNGGHFLDREGFTKLPIVDQILKDMMLA